MLSLTTVNKVFIINLCFELSRMLLPTSYFCFNNCFFIIDIHMSAGLPVGRSNGVSRNKTKIFLMKNTEKVVIVIQLLPGENSFLDHNTASTSNG